MGNCKRRLEYMPSILCMYTILYAIFLGDRDPVISLRDYFRRCIFVISQTGETARDIAKCRPFVPILTFIHSEKIGKQLQLFRGIHPILAPKTFSYDQRGDNDRFKSIVEHAKMLSFVKTGDTTIVVAAEEATEGLGQALTMRIATIL